MSERVSTSRLEPSACSGLMYAGVPTLTPVIVRRAPPSPCVAFAIPKSITLQTGTSSIVVTSTFDGLMSRWMIPF